MAHKRCKKCGGSIRPDTAICPHCGATRRSKALGAGLLFLPLVALAGVTLYIGPWSEGPPWQAPTHAGPIRLDLPAAVAPGRQPESEKEPQAEPESRPEPPSTVPQWESKTPPAVSLAALEVPSLRVTVGVLNLREGPGTGTPVIMKLLQGRELEEVSREGEWIEVRVPPAGREGWVHSAYVAVAPR